MTKKRKKQKPDDSFSYGPLQAVRYGKHIILNNNASEEQFEEMQRMIIDHQPEVIQSINEAISKIEILIKSLPPDRVLNRAWYEMAACHLGMVTEFGAREDEILSLRMVDYLQSVIVSVKPSDELKEDVTDKDWNSLKSLVRDLFRLVNLDYHLGRTALRRKDDPSFDSDYEEFYFKAQLYWCNVRGHRFLCHEILHLEELLSSHSPVFNELFGISAKQFVESIKEIVESLTSGIIKAVQEMNRFRDATLLEIERRLDLLENTEDVDLPNLMADVVRDNGWEQWQNEVFGRVFGLDLFDLEKITDLPRGLLEHLSFGPGEDEDFFSEGEFKGWPLRIWPVFKRPFIKLNGHFYCFDLYTLLDNLYRILQKKIIELKREYKSEWNTKQKEITEQLPFQYLQKILPEAKVYNSVYYKWYPGDSGKKDWCETDGLLIYDDCLFVIEVKAGAFTYTSPTDDFPAYIESIKNLVLKPAVQGRRFIEYLNSSSTVEIFDSEHDPIGELSHSSFNLILNCPISLDSLTEIAAQVQHLKALEIDVSDSPVWSLSINDLRVYADIFDNPLCFLHFCKERMNAFGYECLQLEDELDHLGMYLQHNLYTQYAEDLYLSTNARQNFFGYRADIDSYFSEKYKKSNIVSPIRKSRPSRLFEIVDNLSKKKSIGRSKIANYLLDGDGDLQDEIASKIESTLENQITKKSLIPFSTHGDRNITIVCWQTDLFRPNKVGAIERARAAMLVTGDQERLLIELTHSNDGRIIDVDWSEIKLEDIPADELEYLKNRATEMKRTRLQNAGRIGRNDRCPCGSGKKYKKCCIRNN